MPDGPTPDVSEGGSCSRCCRESFGLQEVATFHLTSCKNDSIRLAEGNGHRSSDRRLIAQRRGQRQRGDDVGKRAERAPVVRDDGEISSGRQALEGEAVAPRTEATLNLLQDAERRPPVPFPSGPMEHMSVADFDTSDLSGKAAPRPVGMTSEHLRPLLSNPNDVDMLPSDG